MMKRFIMIMRNLIATTLVAGLLTTTYNWAAVASDHCDAGSRTGDVCLCELAELHPTQAAVGMSAFKRGLANNEPPSGG